MAVEIANRVQAMLLFTLATPPLIVRSAGVLSVTRTGVGVYEIALEQAPQLAQNGVAPTLNEAGVAFSVVGSVVGDVVVIEAFDVAGAPVDGDQLVFVEVLRFPT